MSWPKSCSISRTMDWNVFIQTHHREYKKSKTVSRASPVKAKNNDFWDCVYCWPNGYQSFLVNLGNMKSRRTSQNVRLFLQECVCYFQRSEVSGAGHSRYRETVCLHLPPAAHHIRRPGTATHDGVWWDVIQWIIKKLQLNQYNAKCMPNTFCGLNVSGWCREEVFLFHQNKSSMLQFMWV